MKQFTDTMAQEWEQRAQENAYHWVVSEKNNWNKDDYFRRGQEHIEQHVLPFFASQNISREDAASFHALDIGCGTGRLSRALSKHVGSVTGVDVSETMLNKAKEDNADCGHIAFIKTNGRDLSPLNDNSLDFVFSLIVFQHIPDQAVIENYFKEIKRVLKSHGLAKVQIRGIPGNPPGKVIWFHGFRSFYLALCLWRNWLPLPWFRRYNTIYGACFTTNQLQTTLKKAGFTNVKVYYEAGNRQHLWCECSYNFSSKK